MSSADDGALRQELLDLRERLREAEETIEAIRHGDVDAVVVGGSGGPAIYTLQSDDRPYRRLIEQIGEGALTLGSDGVVLYCNRALAGLLRVAQESIVGGPLQRFLPAADAVRLERLLERGEGRGEFSLHAGGERRVPVMLSLSELGGGGALCAVVTDLSRQMRASAALHEVNRRLRAEIAERESTEAQLRQAQKMEAVGQLTGGLAHDFNNLLTGIGGALEMMQTRVAQGRTESLGRYIAAAQEAAGRAAKLTHRLLAFSRRQTLDPRPTAPETLLDGMRELIVRTMGPQVAVSLEADEAPWRVLCDANQLENAVLNLCINARDAMPDGGALRIECRNAVLAEDQPRDAPAGEYVAIRVTDTGAGMSPDVVARAFDPFFTTKPIGQGTGLGLSMIYGFVKQSGGQVGLASDPGQGTAVELCLPRHRSAAVPERAAEPAGAGGAASGTVLLVDDEPSVRMLLAETLGALGLAVIEAADGAEGLRVLESAARVDMLVSDVGLPGGLNGRQLADRARVLRPGLPVLLITGYAEAAVLGEGMLETGMEVVTKPFSMAVLGRRVAAVLGRRA